MSLTWLTSENGEPAAVTDRPSAFSALAAQGPAAGVLPKAAEEADREYPPFARVLLLTEEQKRELFSRERWERLPDFIDPDWLQTVCDRYSGRGSVIAVTDRLILREITPDDAPALMTIYDDPVIRRYVEPLPETEEEVRAQIAAYVRFMYDLTGYGFWGIAEKTTGRLIGRAGIEPAEEEGFVSLGYLLAADARGSGFAAEAAAAVIRAAEEKFGIPKEKIRCEIAADHERSIKVAEKLGVRIIRLQAERIPCPGPDGRY